MLMVAATTPSAPAGASRSMSRSISDRLRDQPERVVRARQHFDDPARELELALDRLIRIGDDAERDHFRLVTGGASSRSSSFDRVVLRHQLRLEIEARREVQVAVRRPRKTVNAAVLAAPVRIDRAIEPDIRRLVIGDQTLRGLEGRRRRERRQGSSSPSPWRSRSASAASPSRLARD